MIIIFYLFCHGNIFAHTLVDSVEGGGGGQHYRYHHHQDLGTISKIGTKETDEIFLSLFLLVRSSLSFSFFYFLSSALSPYLSQPILLISELFLSLFSESFTECSFILLFCLRFLAICFGLSLVKKRKKQY